MRLKKSIGILLFAYMIYVGMGFLNMFARALYKNQFFSVIPNTQISYIGYRSVFFLMQELSRSGCGLSEIIKHIKKTYVWIEQVSIINQPHGTYWTYLQVYKPISRIYDKQLLLNNGFAVPMNWYSAPSLPSLYVEFSNYISHKNKLDQNSIKWLEVIPESIRKNYNICWHDKTKILLKPEDQINGEPLLVTVDMQWEKIENIIKKLVSARTYMTAIHKMGKWIADVRFQNQIIIKSGGIKDGTNTS